MEDMESHDESDVWSMTGKGLEMLRLNEPLDQWAEAKSVLAESKTM